MTTGHIDGRRARGRATRQRVLRAASEMFSANGYSATSISALAGASGVRAASIYHAFGSKEGLLAAVVEETAEAFFETLPDPVEHAGGIWGALADVAEMFAVRPEFLRLMLLLAVERRQGDPEILRTAIAVRRQAHSWIAHGLGPELVDLSETHRAAVCDRMSTLIVMLLDGAFVSRQIDASIEETRELFDLLVVAGRAALPDVVARTS